MSAAGTVGANQFSAAWTAEDDCRLRDLYRSASWSDLLVAFPGRTRGSIANHARLLGVARNRKGVPHPWKLIHPVIARDGIPGKFCAKCNEWKPLDSGFRARTGTSGGRANTCKACELEDQNKRYRTDSTARARVIAQTRRWQESNPLQYRMNKRRADAKRRGIVVEGPGASQDDLEALFDLFDGRCAYCRKNPATTIDHVIPLSRGGKHAFSNLLPACKPCNFSKHDLTLEEWAARKAQTP